MLGWQALKANPSKTVVRRALHCPGDAPISLARSLYNLLRLETAGRRNILVGCESRALSETATAAEFAEGRRDVPSWRIIAYQENLYSILWVRFALGVMRKFPS